MDPFGIVSPALGALMPLYNIISSVAGAPREAAEVASQVRKLIEVMEQICNLNQPKQLPIYLKEQIIHVSNDCHATANTMADRLKSTGQDMGVVGRFKWVFTKPETLRHTTQLQAYFDMFRALQVAMLQNDVDILSSKLEILTEMLVLNLRVLENIAESQIIRQELPSQLGSSTPRIQPNPALLLPMALAQTSDHDELGWRPFLTRNAMVQVPRQVPVHSSSSSRVIELDSDNDDDSDSDNSTDSLEVPRIRDLALLGAFSLAKRGYKAYKRH